MCEVGTRGDDGPKCHMERAGGKQAAAGVLAGLWDRIRTLGYGAAARCMSDVSINLSVNRREEFFFSARAPPSVCPPT